MAGNNTSFFGGLLIGNGVAATGNVILTGDLRRANVTHTSASGATFDMSGLTREFGGLNSLRGLSHWAPAAESPPASIISS